MGGASCTQSLLWVEPIVGGKKGLMSPFLTYMWTCMKEPWKPRLWEGAGCILHMHTHTPMHTRTHTNTHVYMCIHLHTNPQIHIPTHTCTHVYPHTYTHTHIHTYIHT